MRTRILLAALMLASLFCVGFIYRQTRPQWEYRVVITSVQTGTKDLNQLGAEGWELVSTDETTVAGSISYVAFLKRLK